MGIYIIFNFALLGYIAVNLFSRLRVSIVGILEYGPFKIWKQPRYPTTIEEIKRVWYIYTMKYLSAIKKDENLLFADKWIELEIIMLNKISQAHKDEVTCFPSHVEARPKT
jgi:hypothetical protein